MLQTMLLKVTSFMNHFKELQYLVWQTFLGKRLRVSKQITAFNWFISEVDHTLKFQILKCFMFYTDIVPSFDMHYMHAIAFKVQTQ